MCEKVAWKSLAKRDRAKQEWAKKNNCKNCGKEKCFDPPDPLPCGNYDHCHEDDEKNCFLTWKERDEFLIEQTKSSLLSDLHRLRDTLGLEGTKEWLKSEAAEFFTE